MNLQRFGGIGWAILTCTLSAVMPGSLQSQVPPPPAPTAEMAPSGSGGIPPGVPAIGGPLAPASSSAPQSYPTPRAGGGSALSLAAIQQHRQERLQRRQQRRQHVTEKVKSLLHLSSN